MRILTTHTFTEEIKLIRNLITGNPQKNFAINFCSLNGDTIFHYAIQTQDVSLFRFVLNRYKEIGVDQIHPQTLNSNTKIGYNTQNEEGYSPLHLAVEKNATSIVEILVKLKGSINITDVLYRTPLHIAIEKNHLECVKLLLSRKEIDIHAATLTGQTPLSLAIEQKNINVIELLLQRGVKIETYAQNKTILNLAIKQENIKVIELLMQRGVKIETHAQNKIILNLAIKSGNRDIVRAILNQIKAIDEIDSNGNTALQLALLHDQPEIALLLIQKINNHLVESGYRGSALHLALKMNELSIAKHLIKAKVGINHEADIDATDEYGMTSLHLAAEKGFREIMEILIASGAKIDHQDMHGNTALHLALINNKIDIIELLTFKGANPDIRNNDNYSSIHIAIFLKFPEEVLMMLFRDKKDINAKDQNGNTLLHLAIMDKNIEAIRALIAKGANPYIYNKECTSIDLAMQNGAPEEVLNMLIDTRTNINNFDQDGNTLLHKAIWYNNHAAVKFLLAKGANPAIEDRRRYTALHLAILRNSSPEIVSTLLQYNTNINSQHPNRNNGNTLLHIAIMHNNYEAVKTLLQQGANPDILNNDDYSSIHLAIMQRAPVNIMRMILDHTLNINFVDKLKNSYLHIAIISGATDIAKSLLEKGIDYRLKNLNNENAVTTAINSDCTEIILAINHQVTIDKTNKLFTQRETNRRSSLLQQGKSFV